MRRQFNATLAIAAIAGGIALYSPPVVAAVAENIVYDLGAIRIVIPRIETSGSTLSDAELKAILDPASRDSVAQRLGNFAAGGVTAPVVMFEIKAGGNTSSFAYRELKLTNVVAGTIENATLEGASGSLKDPKGADIRVNYGAMNVRKVNLGLIVRVMSGRRTDPNEPLATAYEEFSADGFQMASADADVSMGKMTGSGVKMRALATPIADLLALSQTMGAPDAKPTPQQTQAIMAMLSDIFQSFELGRMEARDMKVRPKKEPGGEFGIGRIFMSGFAKARLGEVAYENFVLTMPDGNAKLGRVGLRDLDFSRTFAAFADAARRNDPEFKNTNPRALVPTLGQVQVAGLDLDIADKNGKGNSEDGKRILFKLGSFEINMGAPIEGIPTAVSVSLRNFFFPVPLNPADERLRPIAEAGIRTIDLSHNMDIVWSEAAKEIAIKDYSVGLGGLGAVKLSGVIGNVPKEIFAASLAQAQAAAFGALIKSADVSIENQGAVEMGLALQAQKSNSTPQQVQQMLVAGAAMGIPAMLGDGAAAKAIGAAVSKFAADPKKLRITARAKDGLGASDLMLLGDPAGLMEKLDITATANE